MEGDNWDHGDPVGIVVEDGKIHKEDIENNMDHMEEKVQGDHMDHRRGIDPINFEPQERL